LRNIDETRVRHPRLEQSGWFSQFWGPSGGFPVQLMGLLTTGETVYFRARGSKITLEVAACRDDLDGDNVIARFRKDVVVDAANEFGASLMPEDEAAELIEQWLGEYRSGARPKADRK
jgi:hypothetical protein